MPANIILQMTPPLQDLIEKYDRANSNFYGKLSELLDAMDPIVLGALQAEAPGTNYPSTIYSLREGFTLVYGGAQPLTDYIVQGTEPHAIVAQQGGILAFYANSGDLVFTTEVSHPGTAPNDFPSRAWDAVATDLSLMIKQFLDTLGS